MRSLKIVITRYPFGLTMAGISSKAAGKLEANKRFQGQEFAHKEFSDGSGLEMYEFKYRMDDPQTGRFWQIDPLTDKYFYNSTYAFSENKVTSHFELEGLESSPINKKKDPEEIVVKKATSAKNASEKLNDAWNKFMSAFSGNIRIERAIESEGLSITLGPATAGIKAKVLSGTVKTEKNKVGADGALVHVEGGIGFKGRTEKEDEENKAKFSLDIVKGSVEYNFKENKVEPNLKGIDKDIQVGNLNKNI